MRKKLQESFVIDKNNIKKLPLTESQTIIEKDGEKYNCRGAYELPIWRLDEKNLNERVYSKRLAESIVEQSPVTLGLANHPENEADVRNTFAVEKNPHIREGILYVDAYFVGENGQLANEIIEAGGQIGLSSSAYGEVDDSGNVMVEGFAIERYGDWVDTPSYQVFAGKDHKITKEEVEEKEVPKQEERNYDYIQNEKLFEKSVTNSNVEDNKVDDKKENLMSDSEKKKMSIEEKNLKLGVKHLFEEAESTEDLRGKRQKYEEILDYCDGVEFAEDYIKTAKDEIQKIDEELYELANKGKEVDSLKENTEKEKGELQTSLEEKEEKIKTLEEKYDKAVELLDELKLREQKLNEMYKSVVAEKNGMITASEYRELDQYVDKQEEEIDKLKKENKELNKKLRMAEKKSTRRDESTARPLRRKKQEDTEEEDTSIEESTQEDEYKDYRHLPNFDAVKDWYERKLETEPRIKEFRDEILSKRTLFEAQRTYMRFKDLIEEAPSPYKSSYYGSELVEEEEDKPKNTYSDLPLKDGWV